MAYYTGVRKCTQLIILDVTLMLKDFARSQAVKYAVMVINILKMVHGRDIVIMKH